MSAREQTFRIADYAEALSGPLSLPRWSPIGLERWANAFLIDVQHRAITAAYGLSLGPEQEGVPVPGLNAPVTLAEVTAAVLAITEPFAGMVSDLRALIDGREVDEETEAALIKRVYGAALGLVIEELERRHGDRAKPVHARLH
jgi:hypothetical protein